MGDRENAARGMLMREVYEDRQRQIGEHQDSKQRARDEKVYERLRMEEEMKVVAEIESQYEMQLRAERKQNQLDLMGQMASKEAAKEKKASEDERIFALAQESEKNYVGFIRAEDDKEK